jgi:hypothetical protein
MTPLPPIGVGELVGEKVAVGRGTCVVLAVETRVRIGVPEGSDVAGEVGKLSGKRVGVVFDFAQAASKKPTTTTEIVCFQLMDMVFFLFQRVCTIKVTT